MEDALGRVVQIVELSCLDRKQEQHREQPAEEQGDVGWGDREWISKTAITPALVFLTMTTTVGAINAYSRAQETEADVHAVDLLHRAALEPEALGRLLGRMAKADAPSEAAHWFSTHPELDTRVAAVERLSQNLPVVPQRPMPIDWGKVLASLRSHSKAGPTADATGTPSPTERDPDVP